MCKGGIWGDSCTLTVFDLLCSSSAYVFGSPAPWTKFNTPLTEMSPRSLYLLHTQEIPCISFHRTQRFITAFTSARHLSLSWTSVIQSVTSLFRCLGRTRVSVQVRGFLCKRFVTGYVFTVRSCLHLAQPPSWRTTPCRLSTTAYSIYSQLPSILEAVPPSATWGRVMPWWQGPTYHGAKVTWLQIMVTQLPKSSCV